MQNSHGNQVKVTCIDVLFFRLGTSEKLCQPCVQKKIWNGFGFGSLGSDKDWFEHGHGVKVFKCHKISPIKIIIQFNQLKIQIQSKPKSNLIQFNPHLNPNPT